mmetsp:Transcript_44589/g.93308  ORF Transcript_44589/g.93308 Transcript_44589/m.93308 type:complete len:232 (-) Transcript_44589:302-997(-)
MGMPVEALMSGSMSPDSLPPQNLVPCGQPVALTQSSALSAKKPRRWGHSIWPGGGPFHDITRAHPARSALHVTPSGHSTWPGQGSVAAAQAERWATHLASAGQRKGLSAAQRDAAGTQSTVAATHPSTVGQRFCSLGHSASRARKKSRASVALPPKHSSSPALHWSRFSAGTSLAPGQGKGAAASVHRLALSSSWPWAKLAFLLTSSRSLSFWLSRQGANPPPIDPSRHLH